MHPITLSKFAVITLLAACHPGNAAEANNARTAAPPTPPATELVAGTDTIAPARLSAAFRAAADRALPAVVSVRVRTEPRGGRREPRVVIPNFPDIPGFPDLRQLPEPGPSEGQGSGVIFDAKGYILTNRHVVRDAAEVRVQLSDGREYGATVVGADPQTDVAVIKIEPDSKEKLPVVGLGDSDALEVGDWVLALGNPLGLGMSVTAGIVSAKGRSLGILRSESGESALEAFIQTDAAINPGNSGGALVDLQGRIVGINTAIASRTGYYSGYGFAIPIALATRVASDLISYGAVRRPRLGVAIQDVTATDAEVYGLQEVAGAAVTIVQSGTPAERAGLQLGDVVVALDGRPIRTGNDLTSSLARRQPGEKVRLTVVRDKKRRDITVELGQFETDTPRVAKSAERPAPDEVLGFRAAPLTRELARRYRVEGNEGEVVITAVASLGAAAARGIAPGQVIRKMNGETIASMKDLERASGKVKPGDVVSLIVRTPDGVEQIVNYKTSR
jgi:Do/DeqQ family serine protease